MCLILCARVGLCDVLNQFCSKKVYLRQLSGNRIGACISWVEISAQDGHVGICGPLLCRCILHQKAYFAGMH